MCLEVDEQAMKGTRESEDINTHHLLQQHLYKSRKHVSLFCWIKLEPDRPTGLDKSHGALEPAVSQTPVVCSTVTGTVGITWTSTRTKMRCRRSSRGP